MRALLSEAVRGLRSRGTATAVAVGGLMLAMTVALLVALLALALAGTDPAVAEPERVVLLDFRATRRAGRATGSSPRRWSSARC
ncbi:hypothetical protein [Chitinimonas koreensis]|uniref:hypothetical protein n=1 Tax=Chitinimonas koreensis TaxID=356302 RepID=UPI001654314C|nr:hypothetical protein [Chitinimonas koreensis]QNM95730.1 hypothetical protein H9L41_18040 [Chitinimonas koreensis]